MPQNDPLAYLPSEQNRRIRDLLYEAGGVPSPSGVGAVPQVIPFEVIVDAIRGRNSQGGIPPMPEPGTMEFLDWDRKYGAQVRGRRKQPESGRADQGNFEELETPRSVNPFGVIANALEEANKGGDRGER